MQPLATIGLGHFFSLSNPISLLLDKSVAPKNLNKKCDLDNQCDMSSCNLRITFNNQTCESLKKMPLSMAKRGIKGHRMAPPYPTNDILFFHSEVVKYALCLTVSNVDKKVSEGIRRSKKMK